ncbi:hypothetical protein [Kitasatospora sp. NPDC059571]|uniref:hypothetical protein n=1 Tax=Kitasatospora sp. NPDC059571 TaxID=3346871 RepID=UPI0036A8D3E1
MSTNPAAARPTTHHLRRRTRAWQGTALAWLAVGLQHTLAGEGIRQRYKAQRDRAICAALRRGAPLEPLAGRLGLAPETIRGIVRGKRIAE